MIGNDLPQDDAFVIGQYGSICSQYEGYRQMKDHQKCENAARAIEKDFTVEITEDQPSGCYYDNNEDFEDVWFNGHDIGSEAEFSAPLCILGKV